MESVIRYIVARQHSRGAFFLYPDSLFTEYFLKIKAQNLDFMGLDRYNQFEGVCNDGGDAYDRTGASETERS